MNSTVAKEMLTGFCRSWQKRLCVNIGIKAITITLLLMAAINVLTTISAGGLILIALSSTILLFTGLFFLTKVTRISSLTIAHHLNRTIPELEESCELLLKPEGNSSVLEKMQRKRTLSAFSSLHLNDLLPGTIPQGKWLAGFGIFLLAFIGSTFVPENWLDKPAFQKASVFGGVDTVRNSQDDLTLPTVKSAKIQITPPAYTNKLPYKLSSLQITAEEGALVSWDIELSEHVQEILLVFSGGDTMTLRQGKDLHWRGKRRVLDSGFYHISVSRPGTRAWNSEFHRIDVLKDRPPTIVVLEPEQRTEIALTESRDLAIRAIVDDDYGVVNAHIIATVTSGSGESVKFRESKLDFTSRRERNRSRHEFSRELDLDALGMGLGDELYFFVEAWDNRQPAANRRRSETYFVILNDTTGAVTSAFFGLAINPLPEYFRSQRQIIIDTEKLVAEKTQLSKKEFQRRSNNLGIDQKALRLRYGQFLGEESENGLAIETAPNAETEDGFLDEHEEEFSAEGFEAFGAGKENHEQSGIPDELRHNHDYEENATLFSQS
ncbi:MAG: DUF4175 family protein, partial [bacterium]